MAVCLLSSPAHSLEIGLEGLFELEASNNIEGANAPNEETGASQSLVLGIYGQQAGRRLNAAFSGELDTRKESSQEDSDLDSVSRFLGAAEFKITPRSWTWYAGNILGSVRIDNALQTFDDADLERRNVFVTGPQFEYEQQGISRTRARGLFVNQTEGGDNLENLYTFNLRHERDLTTGSFYGARVGNVFTDLPSASADPDEESLNDDTDFNRATVAAFYNQIIGFTTLFGELGATRYDADNESLSGLNFEARVTQQLGPQTNASVFVTRDLNDQSLSAVESLLQNTDSAIGVQPDVAGFFIETRLGAQYQYRATDTTVELVAGVGTLDFELSSGGAQGLIDADVEDRVQGFASGDWLQQLTVQMRSELGISYESQDFDNRPDNSESLLLRARLIYQLTSSFDLQLGVTHDTATGLRSRFNNDSQRPEGVDLEDIDITETRVTAGIRWAPPSRADQDLIIELRSLLE